MKIEIKITEDFDIANPENIDVYFDELVEVIDINSPFPIMVSTYRKLNEKRMMRTFERFAKKKVIMDDSRGKRPAIELPF